MKKRLGACTFALLLLATPALALASGLTPEQLELQQLSIQVAALEAQEVALSADTSLGCATYVSTTHVAVNQPFALAWGSVGATGASNTWAPVGASIVSISQPGTWTYSFTFYGSNDASTTCTAKIGVSAN